MGVIERALERALRDKGKIIRSDLDLEIDAFLRDLADGILFEATGNIVKQGISDEGTLLNSAQVLANEEGGYDVLFAARHADWIEFGTEPHSVNKEGVEAIIKWVNRKVKPSPNKGESQDKANKRVAWAVINSIKANGTAPQPYLRPAIEKFR